MSNQRVLNAQNTEERLTYIRDYYGVNAHLGVSVRYWGRVTGVIVGAYGPYLLIDVGDEVCVYHPTDKIEYLTGGVV